MPAHFPGAGSFLKSAFLLLITCSALNDEAVASIQLPVVRFNFVAPSRPGESPVDSYQLFDQTGAVQLANSSLNAGRPEAAFCLRIAIGTPRQNITAVVDTGSSDFVAAGAATRGLDRWFHAEASSSLVWQRQLVRTPYTTGFWEGHLAMDEVSVPGPTPGPVRALINVAERSSGFFQAGGGAWQASIGLAFDRLSNARLVGIPGDGNFADALAKQLGNAASSASPSAFSLQLCAGGSVAGSFLSIGSANRTDMLYAAVRYDWYYELVIADIRIDEASIGLDCKEYNMDKAILHSGVGDIRLPKRVHARIVQQLSARQPNVGNRFFSGQGLLCAGDNSTGATARLLNSFQPVTFSLATADNQTVELTLSPAQYLRQVIDGAPVGSNQPCFRFGMQSTADGAILGATFLSGFLVEFDRAGRRVGFAKSSCPEAPATRLSGPKPYNIAGGPFDCAFFRADDHASAAVLRPAAIVMAVVCAMCVLPVCALCIWRQLHRRCRRCSGADEDEGETVQLVPA